MRVLASRREAITEAARFQPHETRATLVHTIHYVIYLTRLGEGFR